MKNYRLIHCCKNCENYQKPMGSLADCGCNIDKSRPEYHKYDIRKSAMWSKKHKVDPLGVCDNYVAKKG